MLEPTRPAQYTLLWVCMSVCVWECVCMHAWEREREKERAFICFASPSFPCCRQGPLKNVSVPFCQSRSQSAKTQKVTLSFTQSLIKPVELWSPSCHCSSLRPSLTHSFVSLSHSLSPYLHHSSLFPLFISYIPTPLSSPYLWSVSHSTVSSLDLSSSLTLPLPLIFCSLWLSAISWCVNTQTSCLLFGILALLHHICSFLVTAGYTEWSGTDSLS